MILTYIYGISFTTPARMMQLWLPGGHLDFPCLDPVGGAFFGRGAFLGCGVLPLWHFSPQCPILSYLEHLESHCRAVCSAGWMLLCAIGAVPGGCRWCVTITIMAGMGTSALVMADCIHRFGAVGDMFSSMPDGKVGSLQCQLAGIRRCLEGFGH